MARLLDKATRALNAGLWVRLMRRPDAFFLTIKNAFLPDHPWPGFMHRVSTYKLVQICGTSSDTEAK